MDDLDWSKFQQQELEEHLMIMPDSSNTTLLQQYRDNCIPVQQLPKIDNSTPNFFPQWKSRSAFQQQQPGPIPDPGPTSTFESIDCLLSASTASIESDGISFIFSTAAKSSSLSDPGGAHIPKRNQTASTKRKRGNNNNQPNSQNINFRGRAAAAGEEEADVEAVAQMKEMIYQAAAFRPVEFGEEEGAERRPKRKNVRISSDPQTVAARERRERISERIRVLQRLVPGGSKMDTASMLDEAASYLKFLRSQVKALGAAGRQRIVSAHVNVVDPTAVGNYANLAFAYSPYLNYPMQQPQQFSIQGPNPIRKPESC